MCRAVDCASLSGRFEPFCRLGTGNPDFPASLLICINGLNSTRSTWETLVGRWGPRSGGQRCAAPDCARTAGDVEWPGTRSLARGEGALLRSDALLFLWRLVDRRLVAAGG